MNITMEQIEEGRKLYGEFLRGMSGGFYTSLFEAIAKAKNENVYRMAAGFPGEVFAYQEYIGTLNHAAWNIEGESAGDKYNRILAGNQGTPFHYKGRALSDDEMNLFIDTLETILKKRRKIKMKNLYDVYKFTQESDQLASLYPELNKYVEQCICLFEEEECLPDAIKMSNVFKLYSEAAPGSKQFEVLDSFLKQTEIPYEVSV